MNFIEAVKATKETGCIIRRACWRGDMRAHYNHQANVWSIHHAMEWDMLRDVDAILGDDWEIIPNPPKLYTFSEMMAMLKDGKKMRRNNGVWTNCLESCVGNIVFVETGNLYELSISDYEATDWVVVDNDNT